MLKARKAFKLSVANEATSRCISYKRINRIYIICTCCVRGITPQNLAWQTSRYDSSLRLMMHISSALMLRKYFSMYFFLSHFELGLKPVSVLFSIADASYLQSSCTYDNTSQNCHVFRMCEHGFTSLSLIDTNERNRIGHQKSNKISCGHVLRLAHSIIISWLIFWNLRVPRPNVESLGWRADQISGKTRSKIFRNNIVLKLCWPKVRGWPRVLFRTEGTMEWFKSTL